MGKNFNLGNIKIYIEETYEEMSNKAADIFCDELKTKPKGVFGFATGSTPVGLYDELTTRYINGNISFKDITSFNLDEYHPIKKDDEQSYWSFMHNNFFNKININSNRINIPNGEAKDPTVECLNYEKKIKENNGIDIQILGIGENGHIGFNEPAESFAKDTNYVSLTPSTINANSRFFKNIDDVPKHAISMGIKTIMKSKKIILIANSSKKEKIIYDALFGEITPKVPASILQVHPDVSVILDKEAANTILKNLQ